MFIVKKFVFHTPYSKKYDSSHIYVKYTCISSHRKKKRLERYKIKGQC